MAEEDEDIGEEADEAADEEPSGGGKKKLLIIIAAVVLLIVGGLAAAYFTGLLDPVIEMIVGPPTEQEAGVTPETVSEGGVYYDLQELLVNLNTGGRKSTFLKIRISLELESAKDIPRIEGLLPRIIDSFQTYLRELRIEDLNGSAGMYRLREELLLRVSSAAEPAKIKDVLFKEMLVQ